MTPRPKEPLRIGQKVQRVPETLNLEEPGRAVSKKAPQWPMTGTVVYVNKAHNFHVVEFETRGGPIRESFKGAEE